MLSPRAEKAVHPRRFSASPPSPPGVGLSAHCRFQSEKLYPKAAPFPRTEAPEPGPPLPDVASRSGGPTPATRKPSSLTPDPALPLRTRRRKTSAPDRSQHHSPYPYKAPYATRYPSTSTLSPQKCS
ncbi:uncharacterized protein [Physeter macrocephalus]|uniref:Uncharacterized protein n=1 Tax=Physeter macrocephalus TaxID=9755 RepID=A0A455AVX1_PHYMC|nr:uncharacterized protein LOC114484897 [Physeter catodon]|eukprot:XP_028340023.1 protein IQ-DOMAIN 14-like [Physeter catodon]